MGISADFNIDISEKGVKLTVKDVNVNSFVIDNVFKKLDKFRKKKDKNKLCSKNQVTSNSESNDGYYTIDIKV